MGRIIVFCVVVLHSTSATAQWLNQPAQGIPRSADGRPNLSAPPPRTSDGKPDLSGLWQMRPSPAYVGNIAADLEPREVHPWAAAVSAQRSSELGKDDPSSVDCLPLGPRHITSASSTGLVKIIQTPLLIVLLFEDLAYRQIFLDGRELPRDPNPSFMGYSVGHWEGDELLVESLGFNERTWLDASGHPHTESLRIIERYRRGDFGHISRRITIDDPKAFTKPFTIAMDMIAAPDTELLEYVCGENPKGRVHLVGRTEQERSIRIASEALARLVGVYEVEGGRVLGARRLEISLSDNQLVLDLDGKGKWPLVPLSDTTFSARLGGTFEFVTDGQGAVTHILVHGNAEIRRAVRRGPSSSGK